MQGQTRQPAVRRVTPVSRTKSFETLFQALESNALVRNIDIKKLQTRIRQSGADPGDQSPPRLIKKAESQLLIEPYEGGLENSNTDMSSEV
jgi:hypothetical protein